MLDSNSIDTNSIDSSSVDFGEIVAAIGRRIRQTIVTTYAAVTFALVSPETTTVNKNA